MKFFAVALAALLPCLAASLDAGKGKVFGNPSAPILIELYSDFQCPGCKGLHEQMLPLIMKDFVAPGKACLVSREFPLDRPDHAHSREAANYVTAAARLGKYQQVSDALFKNQASLALEGKVWEAVASVLTPAEQKKIQALAKDPAVLAEVARDVQAGQAVPITQTPTLIVTYRLKRYPFGGQPNYDLFRHFLDDLLAK
jgi:protein-disulfide isomerase